MKKRLVSLISYVLIGICAAVAIYEGVQIYMDQKEYRVADKEYEDLARRLVEVPASTDTEVQNAAKKADEANKTDEDVPPAFKVDYDALEKINPDFIGWIYFEALDISYPVVREQKENQYIHLTFDGKTNKSGCIFMDTLSSADFSGKSDFIFGHNMRNLSMFGSMKLLYKKGNENLLQKHPYIYIYTKKGTYQYKVFAYETTHTGSSVYDEIKSDDEYDQYVAGVRKRTIYPETEEPDFSERPEILNLSTCSGEAGGTKRFVVHTVKIKTWTN